ncbi:MAG: hypothetical protein ACYC5N_04170 [Endomicrobiales bacterium]
MKTKIIASVSGVLIALLFLEAGLRVFGALQEKRSRMDGEGRAQERVIICVGDSYVYGIGAPADKSFPRQLEETLNAGEEYFVPDGHCNVRGYGIMAVNIARKIREITE